MVALIDYSVPESKYVAVMPAFELVLTFAATYFLKFNQFQFSGSDLLCFDWFDGGKIIHHHQSHELPTRAKSNIDE